jgi:hypothetical protein
VEQVVEWAAHNASFIRAATAAADRQDLRGVQMAVTARLRRTGPATVLMGEVSEDRNPYSGELIWLRKDGVRPERMPLFIDYEPAATERVPAAWFVPDSLGDMADRLRAHGIRFDSVAALPPNVQAFRIDSATTARGELEGHHERRLFGAWGAPGGPAPGGFLRVPANQPLGRLAFTLLEPRSDDGFAAWGLLDPWLANAAVYPILREPAPAAERAGRRQ